MQPLLSRAAWNNCTSSDRRRLVYQVKPFVKCSLKIKTVSLFLRVNLSGSRSLITSMSIFCSICRKLSVHKNPSDLQSNLSASCSYYLSSCTETFDCPLQTNLLRLVKTVTEIFFFLLQKLTSKHWFFWPHNGYPAANRHGGPHRGVPLLLWERRGQVQAEPGGAEEPSAGGTRWLPVGENLDRSQKLDLQNICFNVILQ